MLSYNQMYREHVLSTNPYSYYTLSGSTGNADLMGRSTSLTNVTYTNLAASPPKWYQPIVPGYTASNCASSSFTPGRSFGKAGYENKAFSLEIWTDLITALSGSTYSSSTTLLSQGSGANLIAVDGKTLYVQFTASDPTLNVVLQHTLQDQYDAKFIAVNWGPTVASLFVNGMLVDAVEVPYGFSFSNSTSAMVITAASAAHLAVYDRVQSQEDIARKYAFLQEFTSHSNSVEKDGGELFEMWSPRSNYTDYVLDTELPGTGSININYDRFGLYGPQIVDKLVLSNGTLTQDGSGTVLSSQYLWAKASKYLSQSNWVISIETNDDNSRAGNEYLFTISSPQECLEFYVTSGNVLTVKKTEFFADGTTTTTTLAYDTTVTTTARKFVFVMENGWLYAKTGASSTTLNTVSAASSTYIPINVTGESKLLIGTSNDLTGAAVPKILNVYTHRAPLGSTITGGSYDFYQNQYYSSGYWPLTSSYGLRGQSSQRLECAPYVALTSPVVGAWLINKKSYNSAVTLTSNLSSTTTREPVAAVPFTVIPYNGVAGTDFNAQLTSLVVDQSTDNTRADTQAPAVQSSTLRLFTNRRVLATAGESYIDLSGNGLVWINGDRDSTMAHSKYSGTFFESGSVRGPVTNPLVDGSTVRYAYRAFEFLVYGQSSATNTGHIVSFYDGTTEYYFRISGTSWQTNFSNVKLNGQAIAGASAQYLLDNWVHVYVELPSTIQDRQVYVGGGYNGLNYVNGVGIKNFATYDRVLTAAEIDEHYQCFTGRYQASLGVTDTITIAENADPALYSVAWFTNVVPV